MKKKSSLSKVLCGVLLCGMLLTMVGCGSTKSTSSTGSSSKSTATASKQSTQQAKIKTKLAELVKDGTINSTQSTAVLKALTQNKGDRSGGQKPGNGQQPPTGQKSQTGQQAQGGQQPQAGQTGQAGAKQGPLASLVSNGTITQTQADTIMKALSSIMGQNSGPNANGQSPATNSNSNSSTKTS